MEYSLLPFSLYAVREDRLCGLAHITQGGMGVCGTSEDEMYHPALGGYSPEWTPGEQ
jgi:hypothetical protein